MSLADNVITVSINLAQDFVKELESKIKEITFTFQNNAYPLDKRWELYLVIRKYLPTKVYQWNSKVLWAVGFRDSWYDDFYLERKEIQELDLDFVEECKEKFPSLDMDALKEEILQSGYGAFENDW